MQRLAKAAVVGDANNIRMQVETATGSASGCITGRRRKPPLTRHGENRLLKSRIKQYILYYYLKPFIRYR